MSGEAMRRPDIDAAEAALRPGVRVVLDAWRTLVAAERLQVERLPRRPRPEDFYEPVAQSFRADPRRTDDPTLNALLDLTRPDDRWLDLGAGGGRYTLALALRIARMHAVEPSQGMLRVLTEAAREDGIENVDVYAERWPARSQAPGADVAFMSHVGYDIEDIGPFLDQFEAHAKRLCVAVLYEPSPTADFAPLWQPVHGERRVRLPGLREFTALLFARGRVPEIRLVQRPGRTYPDFESLHRAARRPTWVIPDSDEDRRLAEALESLAVRVDGGLRLGTAVRHEGIVTWAP